MSTVEVLRVLLASPGDLSEERRAFEDVVAEINHVLLTRLHVGLELVKWETHTRPGFAEDAQAVVNQQIGNVDIFVGMMWSRFGTRTGRAASGTEEEFNRAYERLSSSNPPLSVMFYFKTRGVSPDVDTEQLLRVQQFKKKLETTGLIHTFEDADQFVTKTRIHLLGLLLDHGLTRAEWPDKPTVRLHPTGESIETTPWDTEDLEQLAFRGSRAMMGANEAMLRLTGAHVAFSAELGRRHDEVMALRSQGRFDDAAKARAEFIMSIVCDELTQHYRRELPYYGERSRTYFKTFGRCLTVLAIDPPADTGQLEETRRTMADLRSSSATVRGSIQAMRDTVNQFPSEAKQFLLAKDQLVLALNDFVQQMDSTRTQIQEIDSLLARLLSISRERNSG